MYCIVLYCIVLYCIVLYDRSMSYQIIDTVVCAAISLRDNGQVIHSYHPIMSNKANKDQIRFDEMIEIDVEFRTRLINGMTSCSSTNE